MGLNPSNRLEEGLKGFPTLGDPPFPEECKDMAVAELRAAGFSRGSETLTICEHEVYKEGSEPAKMASVGIHMPGMAKPDDIEWVALYDVNARLYGWKFRRAWYYWVAHADDSIHYIPKDVAREFNQTFRLETRVQGYAGGQEVHRPVDLYHVDTPRGLLALMGLLRKQYGEIRHQQLARARGD